jgi:hypothetical protein
MPTAAPGPLDPRTPEPRIVGISTEIGRGHPHYLDCVWQILEQRLPKERLRYTTVFEASRGLSRLGWKSLRAFFRWSSQRESRIRWYNSLRAGQSRSGSRLAARGLSLLGRDLRRELAGFPGICLVEHQLVARMLKDVCRVWFVHADLASPPECALSEPEKTFVPLAQGEQDFARNGCPSDRLVRTGLMIEPELVAGAHDVFHRRLERLASKAPLSVAFFTSGAYPEPHVRRLLVGLESVLNSGLTATVFCGADAKFRDQVLHLARRLGDVLAVDSGGSPQSEFRNPQLALVFRPSRREDTAAAAGLLPGIDVFVAPSHERTNWALGLGLPMFVLFPMIGTHAEANYRLAFDNGVAYPLRTDDDARTLGVTLQKLRASGALANMCRLGFGRFEITGAERIAQAVLSEVAPQTP